MRTFLRSSLVAGVILGLSDMTLNRIRDLGRSMEFRWLKFVLGSRFLFYTSPLSDVGTASARLLAPVETCRK